MKRALLAFFGVIIWTVGAGLALADYDSGLRAYHADQFAVALKEFRVLAEMGDAHAQYALGQMYFEGKGVPKNQVGALSWYRRAAEQGFGKAQYNLAIAYDFGNIVPQDYGMAALWYRKAAEQGDPRSQNNLGYMYETGRGLPQDHSEARKWYEKAAEQGNVHAQINLANSYRKGIDVAPNRAQSSMWYRRAMEQLNSPGPVKLWLIDDSGSVMPYQVLLQSGPNGESIPIDSTQTEARLEVETDFARDRATGETLEEAAGTALGEARATDSTPSPVPPKKPARITIASEADPHGARVQLGAFRSLERAERGSDILRKAHPDLLGQLRFDLSLNISRIDLGPDKGVFFRLQAGPYPSATAAGNLCEELKSRSVDCLIVQN